MRLPCAQKAATHPARPGQRRGVRHPGSCCIRLMGELGKESKSSGIMVMWKWEKRGEGFVSLCFIKLGVWWGNQAPTPID